MAAATTKDKSTFAVRSESDAFGPIDVDGSKYWGAQTQRSLQNFAIGGPESRMPMEVIKGGLPRLRLLRSMIPPSNDG